MDTERHSALGRPGGLEPGADGAQAYSGPWRYLLLLAHGASLVLTWWGHTILEAVFPCSHPPGPQLVVCAAPEVGWLPSLHS